MAARSLLFDAVIADQPAQLRQLLVGQQDVSLLRSAAILAAYGGKPSILQELLASDARPWLLSTETPPVALSEKLQVHAGALGYHGRSLLSQPPIVIAACQLHTAAVELLRENGAELPATVGDSSGSIPLLAFWVSQLPYDGDHPAALPMLRLLVRAGADPLAAGTAQSGAELAVGGRVGSLCSFLLTCRHPPLLAAGVRLVLEQCSAVAGGRELSPPQLAVLLVAARVAGLGEESERLMAQAAFAGNCFPSALEPSSGAARHPGHPRWQPRPGSAGGGRSSSSGRSTPEKRRRVMAGARGAAGDSDSEEEEEEGGVGLSDSDGDSDTPMDAPLLGPATLPAKDVALLGGGRASQLVRQPWMECLYQQHAAAQAALLRGQEARQLAEGRLEEARGRLAAAGAAGAAGAAAAADAVARAESELASARTVEDSLTLRCGDRYREMAAHMEQERRQGRSVYYSTADFATDPFGPRPPSQRRLDAPPDAAGASTSAAAGAGAEAGGAAQASGSAGAGPSSTSAAAAAAPGKWSPLGRRMHLARLLRRSRGSPSIPPELIHPSSAAARRTEWHRRLRAQLVADAAVHGLHDVLQLMLSQGASPIQTVPWTSWPQLPAPPGLRPPPHLALLMPGGERSPLALAAAAGHRSCVLLLRRHGAAVDMGVLRHAVWSLSAEGVAALLSEGCGQLPPSVPCSYAEGALNCPVLLLLQRHLEMAAGAVLGREPPAALARLEAQAVCIMDMLYDAGYRIRVYRDMCGKGADGVWRMGRFFGLQADEHARLGVSGRNRTLWSAYCRSPWSADAHASFHPAFKAAARMLLLVARWGEDKQRKQEGCRAWAEARAVEGPQEVEEAEARGCAAHAGTSDAAVDAGTVAVAAMARLPLELLHKIIGHAAYPLSKWVCVGQA